MVDLKVLMALGAFNILVCDQTCNMADIRVQGMNSQLFFLEIHLLKPFLTGLTFPSGLNGSLLMQGPQTHISARLRDVVVLDIDPKTVHQKVSDPVHV